MNIDPAEVKKLASRGFTDRQLAAMLGISARTLFDRKKNDPAILEAYQAGEAKALAAVEDTLFKAAIEDGDVSACKFILSTRRRDTYTTRQELANAGDNAFRIEAKPLTPKERKAAIAEINAVLEHET